MLLWHLQAHFLSLCCWLLQLVLLSVHVGLREAFGKLLPLKRFRPEPWRQAEVLSLLEKVGNASDGRL